MIKKIFHHFIPISIETAKTVNWLTTRSFGTSDLAHHSLSSFFPSNLTMVMEKLSRLSTEFSFVFFFFRFVPIFDFHFQIWLSYNHMLKMITIPQYLLYPLTMEILLGSSYIILWFCSELCCSYVTCICKLVGYWDQNNSYIRLYGLFFF